MVYCEYCGNELRDFINGPMCFNDLCPYDKAQKKHLSSEDGYPVTDKFIAPKKKFDKKTGRAL